MSCDDRNRTNHIINFLWVLRFSEMMSRGSCPPGERTRDGSYHHQFLSDGFKEALDYAPKNIS